LQLLLISCSNVHFVVVGLGQGSTYGRCWLLAAPTTFEDQASLRGYDDIVGKPSIAQLFDCLPQNSYFKDCSGGHPFRVWQWLQHQQVVPLQADDYRRDTTVRQQCNPQ